MKAYETMDQDERNTWNHRAAQLMEKLGGGFASALALAYYRADSGNRAAIVGAFPGLFDRYRTWAQEERED
jgi:hypothetical protein